MREVIDGRGKRWNVSEVGYYGFGAPGNAEPNTAWVHFTSGDQTLKLEAPRGLIPSLTDRELAQTVDWMIAMEEVRSTGKQMREITDEEGTPWLITEEGLPGPLRGDPGGIALRFISRLGRRYLVPVPPFWRGSADERPQDYLRGAHPPFENE